VYFSGASSSLAQRRSTSLTGRHSFRHEVPDRKQLLSQGSSLHSSVAGILRGHTTDPLAWSPLICPGATLQKARLRRADLHKWRSVAAVLSVPGNLRNADEVYVPASRHIETNWLTNPVPEPALCCCGERFADASAQSLPSDTAILDRLQTAGFDSS